MSEQRVYDDLIARLVAGFGKLPQVEAVALGGSRAGSITDAASDIDLYVYTHSDIPLDARQVIVEQMGGATVANLGLAYWGPGDEWFDAATGIEIDIVYFDARWMEDQLNRVIRDGQGSMGYTTCFWNTVQTSRLLHDPRGWFAWLQEFSRQPYPEALRESIIAINHPVLRNIIPAYAHQVEKAVTRGDLVSINHRLAALFASYFDVIFAINHVLHPGEKRLVQLATERCPSLPGMMVEDVTAILQAAGDDPAALAQHIQQLLDRLDLLLEAHGFDPVTSRPYRAG